MARSSRLRDRCVVLTSDQRVVATRRDLYGYPDVSIVCGPVVAEPGTSDVLANPTIVVRTRTWLHQSAGTGEQLALSNDVVLYVDALFAGLPALPSD